MPVDPETQLTLFRRAVQLLGGAHAAADRLAMSRRHCFRLLAGGAPLHEAILRDTAKALELHADDCRQCEKRLFPMSRNLTTGQLAARDQVDLRRFGEREA